MLQNAGANRIISMDIHTTAIEGFYHIPFDKLSPFEIYVEKIKELFKQRCGNLKLVSPDFGFIKKMEKYQEALGCDMAVINKTRVKANEVSKMELIGDVKECHVILIDDLIDTATTLVKAADLVLSKGALSVTVLSTHGVLSEGAVKRLMLSNIETVYISNTISKNLDTYELEKIKTIDVSDIFAKAILKIENE